MQARRPRLFSSFFTLAMVACLFCCWVRGTDASDFRCFSGITTLSGTSGSANDNTSPCPGGYCAADWQLAFDPATGAVARFSVLLGPHQVDLSALHGGSSVQQVLCDVDAASSSELVFSVRSGYQNGATTFSWRYDSAQVTCEQARTASTALPGFLGMVLDIVVLNVGSWSSANADVQPQFSLDAFETNCAAISLETPPSVYCYSFADIALAPLGSDAYVSSFQCSDASMPCVVSLNFCLDVATQSEVSQLAITLNGDTCLSSGVQDTLSVSCVGDSALLVATDDTIEPSIHVSFLGTGVCDGQLESATNSIGVQVIVTNQQQSRYGGSVASPASLAAHRSTALDAAAPCSVWTAPTHVDSSDVACEHYCLRGLVQVQSPNCVVHATVTQPCEFIYHIDLTMCENGLNTVHWYNISLDDGSTIVALDEATPGLEAVCFANTNTFGVGVPGLSSVNFLTWSTVGMANCTGQMWTALPTWGGAVTAIDVFSLAAQTQQYGGTILNNNNTLANSVCGQAEVPSATSTPSLSASMPPSPSPLPSPSSLPSGSATAALSQSSAPSSAPSQSPEPLPPCSLRCLSGSGYYKNNRQDPAWALLPPPHELCGFDYSLLVDASNKLVKKIIPTPLVITALRLVATLDLNLAGNLVNSAGCSTSAVIATLPANVSQAYWGVHTRYANASLCLPQTFSLGDEAASMLQQWVDALTWFLDPATNPLHLLDCDAIRASEMAQSNTWENAKHKRAVEPVQLCTSRLGNDTHLCLSVFAYRNPNDECIYVGAGTHNRLIPESVIDRVIGCMAPTQFFGSHVGGSLHDLLNGTFAVLWHCKRYHSRHLTWRLGTRLVADDAPPPQHNSWVYRRADAYWLVDTCSRATMDYWLNFQCY